MLMWEDQWEFAKKSLDPLRRSLTIDSGVNVNITSFTETHASIHKNFCLAHCACFLSLSSLMMSAWPLMMPLSLSFSLSLVLPLLLLLVNHVSSAFIFHFYASTMRLLQLYFTLLSPPWHRCKDNEGWKKAREIKIKNRKSIIEERESGGERNVEQGAEKETPK